VVVLAEHLERAVLELGGLWLFDCDRIRGVGGLPRQVLFARGITELAPDRHRPLAWPLDPAVGVEASFAGHFTRTLLVWIGSVHSLALGYCRLPTQPCVCLVKLKESFIAKKFGPNARLGCPVCIENSDSQVVVMQSAEECLRRDATDPLNGAREWCVFVQRAVRSQIVAIPGIGLQITRSWFCLRPRATARYTFGTMNAQIER
jgi:hypothetical protein